MDMDTFTCDIKVNDADKAEQGGSLTSHHAPEETATQTELMTVSGDYCSKAVRDWLVMAVVAGIPDYAPDGVKVVSWLVMGLLLAHLIYSAHTAKKNGGKE